MPGPGLARYDQQASKYSTIFPKRLYVEPPTSTIEITPASLTGWVGFLFVTSRGLIVRILLIHYCPALIVVFLRHGLCPTLPPWYSSLAYYLLTALRIFYIFYC